MSYCYRNDVDNDKMVTMMTWELRKPKPSFASQKSWPPVQDQQFYGSIKDVKFFTFDEAKLLSFDLWQPSPQKHCSRLFTLGEHPARRVSGKINIQGGLFQ